MARTAKRTSERSPADALESQWRWLAHAAASDDPDVRQRTVEILEEAAAFESSVRRDYVGRYPLELLQNGTTRRQRLGGSAALTSS